jgi:phosphoribosylaminoimidazolecarboxamide formyltransferase/IMP cyclohydrolase
MLHLQTAIISVTDKIGLEPFVKQLRANNPSLRIIASGGTGKALGVPYTPLHEYTGSPECFGGRVKTLHPKIMGGILYRRGVDDAEAKQMGIEPIDLVVCNLYDFEKASRQDDMPLEQLIEYMDIGGSTLIRSACKNYENVAIVVDPNDYPKVAEGKISLELRRYLAAKAIELSASYEALLSKVLSKKFGSDTVEKISLSKGKPLRYGENPDQQAWVYELPSTQGIVQSKVLSGKELSYNNYEDATVAYEAVQLLTPIKAEHCVAIVKHGNICGYATGKTETEAFEKAWEGDDKSAFGSVIAFLSPVTEALIPFMKQKFIEVLIAPSFDEPFVAWIKSAKPNVRLLQIGNKSGETLSYKSISGGILVQTKKKNPIESSLGKLLKSYDPQAKVGVVTKKQPNSNQQNLCAFGIAAVNFAKSNAIAIVREYAPGYCQLLGMGSGQPNRIDSIERLAIPKALDNLRKENSVDLSQCLIVSDGFFPFDDSVKTAASYGLKFCIQPGGSTNDASVIAAADANDMCMIFTGERYFNH